MRKLLNVLYVTTPEAFLARDGECILVKIEDEIKLRLPIHNLEGVVTFGYTGASPAAMRLCAENGVSLTFLSASGRFIGRFIGETSGNVLLRRTQYRIADTEAESLKYAKSFLIGKISNHRSVLNRAVRDHRNEIKAERVMDSAASLMDKIKAINKCKDFDTLRGIEGDAAHAYFSVLDNLILNQKDDFFINNRNRRPPMDNMNALLSFIYTLLCNEVTAALETVGLDPQVGFLHKDRPGRASLALDLMEELRPFLADRLALSLVNRKQIDATGFIKKESGGIIMNDETRKTIIAAWQKRKQDEITHPFLEDKIPIGLLPYAQALLLARSIRGDLDGYPPFLWK